MGSVIDFEEVNSTDTAVGYPGKVTQFIVRWTTQSAEPFSYDATTGPRYVCDILHDEDNDLKRFLHVIKAKL